jgi:hypothetical protein
MKVGPKPPQIEWRSVAITDTDPLSFALTLQTKLQQLTDEGFNVLFQIQRGTGLVITANRTTQEPPRPASVAPTLPAPPPPNRRFGPPSGKADEQFVYHYISPEGPRDRSFTSIVEALRMVRSHVDGDDGFVPGYLVAMHVVTFEAPQLTALLKAYADDIASTPNKQVD